MKKHLLLLLLMSICMGFVNAQSTLVLKKLGTKRKYVFSEGERIKLQLKETKEVLEGSWYHDRKETIIISGHLVKLQDIYWLDISSKEKGIYLLRRGQDLLLMGGAGYFAIAQLNHLIETGEFVEDNNVYKASAALVAGGLTCAVLDRVFRKRKVKVGKKRFRISLAGPYGI